MVIVMASEPCLDLHPNHSLVVMQEIGGMFCTVGWCGNEFEYVWSV